MVAMQNLWKYVVESGHQNGDDSEVVIDLCEVFGEDWSLGTTDSVERNMSMKGKFDKEKLLLISTFNLYDQRIKLSLMTWEKIRQFANRENPPDFFTNRATRAGQIGTELFLVASRLDANDYFERGFRGKMFESPNKIEEAFERAKQRDRHFDATIYKLFAYIESPTFELFQSPETKEFSTAEVKKLLSSPCVLKAIATTIDRYVQPGSTFHLSGTNEESATKKMRNDIRSMNIYVVKKLNDLYGCVLRDGFVLCLDEFCFTKGDPRYEADLLSTAIHELSHFVLRQNYDTFGWGSPTSYLPSTSNAAPSPSRRDPVVPGAYLEIGRATELTIFGGAQIKWLYSEIRAATHFLDSIRNRSTVAPIYASPQHRRQWGYFDLPDNERSFAFPGNKQIGRMPH